MDDVTQDTAGVVAPPPLIYAAGLGIGLLLHKLVPVRFLPPGWARYAGWPLVAVSFLPGASAAVMMRRAKTALNPHRPTTAFVPDGPFKYTRNPIYVSFTLLYTGITILANSLWTALLLPLVLVVMQRGVIEREERYLERKFGAQYLKYKAGVRRWI